MILGIPTKYNSVLVTKKNLSEGCQVFKHHRKTPTPGIGLKPLFSPGVRKSKTFYVKARE